MLSRIVSNVSLTFVCSSRLSARSKEGGRYMVKMRRVPERLSGEWRSFFQCGAWSGRHLRGGSDSLSIVGNRAPDPPFGSLPQPSTWRRLGPRARVSRVDGWPRLELKPQSRGVPACFRPLEEPRFVDCFPARGGDRGHPFRLFVAARLVKVSVSDLLTPSRRSVTLASTSSFLGRSTRCELRLGASR